MSDTRKRASIGARRNPETETAILDAAEALIHAEGYAALTMEAVSRQARAGKATLYRWWPSKAHLLLALYSRSKTEIANPDTGSLKGDATAYLTATFALLSGEGTGQPLAPMLQLLIAEAQIDPAVREAFDDERAARWHHFDHLVQKAVDRGELNPALRPEHAVQRLVSAVWYLLLTNRIPGRAEVPELVDALLAGMTAP